MMIGYEFAFLALTLWSPFVIDADVIEFPHQEFKIPYRTPQFGDNLPDYGRLFISQDRGKTWQHYVDFTFDEVLKFRASKDGLYWFTVQGARNNGSKFPIQKDFAPLVKVYVNSERHPVIRLRPKGVLIQPANEDLVPPPPPFPGPPDPPILGEKEKAWTKYGSLHETKLRCENGQPIYALRDGAKLITYVAAKPGKTLRGFIGQVVAVYGPVMTASDEQVRYRLASHFAISEFPSAPATKTLRRNVD